MQELDNATAHKQILLAKGIRCGLNFAQTVTKLQEDVTKLKNKSSDQNRCILYHLGKVCGSKHGRKMIGLSWRIATATRKGCRQKEATVRPGYPASSDSSDRRFLVESRCVSPSPSEEENEVTYLLETNYTCAFKLFQQKHPDIKVKYVKFIQTKPSNVSHMKAIEMIVCYCIKCENIKQQFKALNVCAFAWTKHHLRIPPDVRDISNLTLCPYEEFPASTCLEHSISVVLVPSEPTTSH